MLETEESVAHIDSNVFVGSLEGAEDRRLLERLGISNILTVDTHRPRVSASMKWWASQVEDTIFSTLLDLSQFHDRNHGWRDLRSFVTFRWSCPVYPRFGLTWIQDFLFTKYFLSDCLGEGGGGVLVHCRYVCTELFMFLITHLCTCHVKTRCQQKCLGGSRLAPFTFPITTSLMEFGMHSASVSPTK